MHFTRLLRIPHSSARAKRETYPAKPPKRGCKTCPLSPQAWAKALGCLSGYLPKRRRPRRKTVPKSSEPSEGAPKGKHQFLSHAPNAFGAILVLTACKLRWQVESCSCDGCRHVDDGNGHDHLERSRRSRSGCAIPPDHSVGVVPDRQGPWGTSLDAVIIPGTTRF